ncbi:MAG TPA: DUF1801 domain-containing protein [Nitrosopumilaceae archaeon]|nr:DUF1801 domain-containing protein [Nitrosopumilaceae archaeon]
MRIFVEETVMTENKKQNQKTVEEYLDTLPKEVRATLEKIRQTIKKVVPEAEEVISYQMPAFKFHGMLVWYAAFKNHYSLFVRSKVLQAFNDELKPYETSKATIKISLDQPVPVGLVTKIVKFGAKENLARSQLKTSRKKVKLGQKK